MPCGQPSRGFADKGQHGGRRKDSANTNVPRDVSVETIKHSSFFQNGWHCITAPRANLSDYEFHKVNTERLKSSEPEISLPV
jgi:hypothetical protein